MNYFDYCLFRPIKSSEKKVEVPTPSTPVKVVERQLSEAEIEALLLRSEIPNP